MQRSASDIDLKPETILDYKKVHAHTWQSDLDTIHACNICDYFIYQRGNMLYAYFEYVGSDYADMTKRAEDPITQAWWKLCGLMQMSVPDAMQDAHQHDIKEGFHTS